MKGKHILFILFILLASSFFVDYNMTGFVIKKRVNVVSCYDSDSSLTKNGSFFIKGFINAEKNNGEAIFKEDSCNILGTKVIEWNCKEKLNELQKIKKSCSLLIEGSVCQDGACTTICGDGFCVGMEDCLLCSQDCGVCSEENQPTYAPSFELPFFNFINFFIAGFVIFFVYFFRVL